MTSSTSESTVEHTCATCGRAVEPIGAGRWTVHPAHCAACTVARAAVQADEARRGRVAGLFEQSKIPERYRSFRLEHRAVARMDQEPWADFAARVRMDPAAIGVTRHSALALRAAREWLPTDGSIYFEGNVGGGKTTLACAIATKFLRQEQSALYMTEGDLWESVRSEQKTLYRLAGAAQILVWDDWGTTGFVRTDADGKPTVPSPKDWQREAVEDVIAKRYNARLPTLFTANVPLEQATLQWSARVGSRLTEMVGSRKVALVDHDWRSGAAFGGAAP